MTVNVPVVLPALGEAIESATISVWLKAVGDAIALGEPLVEVSTDKVDSEIESTAEGVLLEIRVEENDVAAVGDVIAVIAVEVQEPAPVAPDAPAPHVPAAEPPAPAGPLPDDDSSVGDVALKGTTQKMTRLRKTIASRMVASLQGSAQLTTIVEVDVTEVGRLRRQHNSSLTPGEGVKLSYLPFIAAAALGGLQAYPQVNSTVDIESGTITYPAAEHLGIAVDTDKGLFVPVIRDAGSMTVTELAARIADLAERTRTNRVGVDDLTGGTFTITNTGSRGALMDTPIINQPQVAILGAGVVTRRPVVHGREGVDESIAIRSMVYLSLTYDHRVVDGADAARYLSDVKARLERASFDI
ncbi:2-oxo acid dehydrogenase subunit E2 [Aeromicrobium endophyticum]|uniref:Dihydrolipoamide acetyltransferase component of pyruvate dehydrogenase complex n=1 Tax=Aeromicrobium endophyticum TaxID=2292704 RepID=A0A371NYS5_9ACTN|nr:2-oxo acid dehydrogenase subunit E2 [Aeromicrobium endophyticum]REK68847.1 dihydrolipoyllysine succinyltransferase [Aeromicrobium endophyticum]